LSSSVEPMSIYAETQHKKWSRIGNSLMRLHKTKKHELYSVQVILF
jgi:hypothetical protein